MRITGDGIWGEPKDPEQARAVLRKAVELGVDFIDTADSYGPEVSERLIGEALYPYQKGVVIATKGGFTRQGPNQWAPVGRPEYLTQCVEMSLRRLRVERIDLYQLHRIDPKVPVEESLGALKKLQQAGKIRHIGLIRSDSRGNSAFAKNRQYCECPEPLQPFGSRARKDAGILREAQPCVHSVVPGCRRKVDATRGIAGFRSAQAQGICGAAFTCMAASSLRQSCCPFPALRRLSTSRKILRRLTSSWPIRSGRLLNCRRRPRPHRLNPGCI